MTPIWMLDVDGVINAFSPDATWDDWVTGYAEAQGRHWRIKFSPSVIAFINAVHASGLAEVRWLTTWEDDAQGELTELLGITHLEVAGRFEPCGCGKPRKFSDRHWFKECAVRAVLASEPSRPIIWTDDDLSAYSHLVKEFGDENLLVATDPSIGLSPADLNNITRFITSHNDKKEVHAL